MPIPHPNRAEVWIADLGMVAKTRPVVVLGVPSMPNDRVLFTVIPRTTSLHGTRFEIAIPKPFFKGIGAFDAQGVVNGPLPRFHRKLGFLLPDEMALIEDAVRLWLGL